jgi:hypothetical protein
MSVLPRHFPSFGVDRSACEGQAVAEKVVSAAADKRRTHMSYEAPVFVEIKMDAEIGSYQDEFEFDNPYDPMPSFVDGQESA